MRLVAACRGRLSWPTARARCSPTPLTIAFPRHGEPEPGAAAATDAAADGEQQGAPQQAASAAATPASPAAAEPASGDEVSQTASRKVSQDASDRLRKVGRRGGCGPRHSHRLRCVCADGGALVSPAAN